MPKVSSASLPLIIHRLTYPDKDVREVVKMTQKQLTDQLMTGGINPSAGAIAQFSEAVDVYKGWHLPDVRKRLATYKIRGPSTYTLGAAVIKAAEYDLETLRMQSVGSEEEEEEEEDGEDKGEIKKKKEGEEEDFFKCEDGVPDQMKKIPSSMLSDVEESKSFGGTRRNSSLFPLDAHQLAAIEQAKRCKLTLINAGPRTGKTTTLCMLIRDLITSASPPSVLVLSFTIQAEEVMTSKIKDAGCSDFIVSKYDIYHTPGVCVLTFDKFAYSLTKATYSSYEQSKLEALSQLKTLSAQKKMLLDYLVVDECQDLSLVEYKMMKELANVCRKVVMAGDPRQECSADCSHFSREWCESREKASEVAKVHLVNNYRSCSSIVRVLNNFAAKHFPNIGGTEPLRSKRGKCKDSLGGCLKIFHCASPSQIGLTVGKNLRDQSRK